MKGYQPALIVERFLGLILRDYEPTMEAYDEMRPPCSSKVALDDYLDATAPTYGVGLFVTDKVGMLGGDFRLFLRVPYGTDLA